MNCWGITGNYVMRTKLFTLFFAVLASVGTMLAESGTCGEKLTWDLTDGVLTISGEGQMNDYHDENKTPWFLYRSDIRTIHIKQGVTSIGSYAFNGSKGLISIEIPNSVTSIGDGAFGDCEKLEKIDVETFNNSFSSVDGVLFNKDQTTIVRCPGGKQGAYTIPNSVTNIGEGAFYSCIRLTSITIPNSVRIIGYYAFAHCISMTAINIPNFVNIIGDGAFYGCYNLTSVTIGNNVTNIGWQAFTGCSNLKSIIIPYGVKRIEDKTFYSCGNLTSITIPNSVTSIGSEAFWSCNLIAATIPNSVIKIESGAFEHCDNLTSIVVESGNPKYDSRNNCNAIIETSSNTLVVGCQNTIIPDGVTSIGTGAFGYCYGLDSVIIPNSVTTIGIGAFYVCSDLTSITIPNSVTSIGDDAFEGCDNLQEVHYPKGLDLSNAGIPSETRLIAYDPQESQSQAGSNLTSQQNKQKDGIAQILKIILLEPRIGDGSTQISGMEKAMIRGELRKAVTNHSGFEAITRADIDQMMKTENFSNTGVVSEAQIKKLSKISEADYICVSTVSKSDTEFYIEAYLVHLKSGRMSNIVSQYGDLQDGKLANMFPACQTLINELLKSTIFNGTTSFIRDEEDGNTSEATYDEYNEQEEDEVLFVVVEEMPEFPGGQQALFNYLIENVKYPVIAQENGIMGRVVCQFVVNREGSIVDVEVVRSSGVDVLKEDTVHSCAIDSLDEKAVAIRSQCIDALDKEAVRVVKSMPKWKPGKQRGKAVCVKYTVPINFKLQ